MIKTLKITCFRAIPSDLEISFIGNNGSLSSVLLLGENGTGKSSVADSLEFCLRGKVSRRGNAGAKIRYESRNLLAGGNPSVQVTFDDGRQFIRGVTPANFPGVRLRRDDFAPGFSLSPVVLSRADIDVFWQVSAADRMRFFFDYLRDSVQHSGYTALEIERYEGEIETERVHLLEAQITLAKVSSYPVGQIPVDDRVEFYAWRSQAYPQYGTGPHSYGVPDPERAREIGRTPGNIRAALSNLAQHIESIHKLKNHLKAMRDQIGNEVPPVIAADLPTILNEISEQVSADFAAIAKITHVQEVRLQPSENGYELDVACRLSTGSEVQPTQILSEAYLDLLALLILLGVTRACVARGQTRFLVLDDVWQSIDSIHRQAILQYVLSERFHDWQLVVTVHDRLWARVIEDRARIHGFPLRSLELVDWTPQEGPRLRYGDFDTAVQLSALIADATPEVLASFTGRALEELSDRLSVSLRTSVQRKFGDRYTLEDLWPGVYKRLRKARSFPALMGAAEQVNNIYWLRNLYSAHYSTWAESLSATEIRDFARHVVALWVAARCTTCGTFISRLPNSEEIGWSCGHAGNND